MESDQLPKIPELDPNSGTAARIEWLTSRGVIGPPGSRCGELMPVGPAKPGALQRFLDER